jgi:hypothetical protein
MSEAVAQICLFVALIAVMTKRQKGGGKKGSGLFVGNGRRDAMRAGGRKRKVSFS